MASDITKRLRAQTKKIPLKEIRESQVGYGPDLENFREIKMKSKEIARMLTLCETK
jgi:hypothetical protein